VCFALALTIPLLAFAGVQIPQRIFRHHAEKLLADFHSIRLHRSTWADAEKLMTRWGAYGHYDGTCTEASCIYSVKLMDVLYRYADRAGPNVPEKIASAAIRLDSFFGGHAARIFFSFTVRNGLIVRSRFALRLEVMPSESHQEYEYGLLYEAKADESLRPWNRHHESILGSNEQLAQHPNYKEGRPGGCKICMLVEITFTPAIEPNELQQITALDLSCLTRFHPCMKLPDLLPVAKDWYLYPDEGEPQEPPSQKNLTACDIPSFVKARDAAGVIAVETGSRMLGADESGASNIRDFTLAGLSVLKDVGPTDPGSLTRAVPSLFQNYIERYPKQVLQPDKQYVLFLDNDSDEWRIMDCGILEDSPLLREQLQRGFAQNDLLPSDIAPVSDMERGRHNSDGPGVSRISPP